MEQKRMNASEQIAIKQLAIALTILQDHDLDKRLEGIKYGKRDMGNLRSTIQRVFEGLMATVPLEQALQLRKTMQTLKFSIGVPKPINRRDDEYGMWVSMHATNTLANAALEQCMLCECSEKEMRACEIRKALDELPIPLPAQGNGPGKCPYFGM